MLAPKYRRLIAAAEDEAYLTELALPHTLNTHGVSRHASRLRHIICPQKEMTFPVWSNFRRVGLALGVLLTSLSAFAAGAHAQGLPLIRDAEIEALLQDYAKPIFSAAGFGTGRVTVRIVRNEILQRIRGRRCERFYKHRHAAAG